MSGPSHVLLVMHRGGRAGTEYHVLWLAIELRARGWRVDLAVSESGPILRDFREAGIEAHIVRRHGRNDLIYLRNLARLVRGLAPDILHAHSGRLAALAARMATVPAILETRHGLGLAPRAEVEAHLCRLAHHTLTVCESDRGRLVSGGLPPDRVTAVPNGIPIIPKETHSFDPARLRLGFLGRMTAQKNPLFLADLAGELQARIPGRWSLALAGEGPMRRDLERRIADRPELTSGMRWLGETDGPAPVIDRSDFLCLPSLWEGQPLAALEGMAAGVVPVATPLASMRELLGGEPPAGLLIEADARAWAEELIALHASRPRFDALAGEGQRRIMYGHRISSTADRIEAIYRAVFASRRGGQ